MERIPMLGPAPGSQLAPGDALSMPLPKRYVRCAALSLTCLLLVLVAYLPALRAPPARPDPARSAAIAGWERGRPRDLRLYVRPADDTALLLPAPDRACGGPGPGTEAPDGAAADAGRAAAAAAAANSTTPVPLQVPYLLVAVSSAPDHGPARAAIRDTWGGQRAVGGLAVRMVFVLGVPPTPELQAELESESRRHGDILQENFTDSYNNLTLKSVFMLKWTLAHCPGLPFLMKTDDDMFVNVVSLVRLLQTIPATAPPPGSAAALAQARMQALVVQPAGRGGGGGRMQQPPPPPLSLQSPLLLGALFCGARPITNANDKWYAPRYLFSGRVYPNYLSGTGYVLSGSALRPLYSAALHTPFFHLEDVFVTGLCARRAGLRPRDHPAFSYSRRRPDPCLLQDRSVVTSHHMEGLQLRQLWAAMSGPSLNCTQPPAPAAPAHAQQPSLRPAGRKVTAVRRPGYRCV